MGYSWVLLNPECEGSRLTIYGYSFSSFHASDSCPSSGEDPLGDKSMLLVFLTAYLWVSRDERARMGCWVCSFSSCGRPIVEATSDQYN